MLKGRLNRSVFSIFLKTRMSSSARRWLGIEFHATPHSPVLQKVEIRTCGLNAVVWCAELRVKEFGKSVQFEPLPSFVLRMFERRLKGRDLGDPTDDPDLSRVDDKLRSSLLTFQREGVMWLSLSVYRVNCVSALLLSVPRHSLDFGSVLPSQQFETPVCNCKSLSCF